MTALLVVLEFEDAVGAEGPLATRLGVRPLQVEVAHVFDRFEALEASRGTHGGLGLLVDEVLDEGRGLVLVVTERELSVAGRGEFGLVGVLDLLLEGHVGQVLLLGASMHLTVGFEERTEREEADDEDSGIEELINKVGERL